MARIAADRRALEYVPRPEVQQWLLDHQQAWRDREVDFANALGDIAENKHYLGEACASEKEYARKLGFHGPHFVALGRTGRAIRRAPELEQEFRSGRIPLESGPYLFDALRNEAIRDKLDWIAFARQVSAPTLGAHVRRAIEETARGTQDLRTVSVLVTDEDRDNFRRARFLLQAKHRRALTEGEALSMILKDWLREHDPVFASRRRRAKRQAESPAARRKRLDAQKRRHKKRNRHIPSETVDEVVDRSDGRCEIPGCTNEGATELMHLVVPFAQGGDPVPRNVGNGCPTHHTLVDGLSLKCIHFTPDGRPIFEDRKGRILYPEPRPPPLDDP